MIIFGIGDFKIVQEKSSAKCGHCTSTDSMHFAVFQKYFHLFWIPLLPIDKFGKAKCANCKHLSLKEDFNSDLLEDYFDLEAEQNLLSSLTSDLLSLVH